MSTNIFVSLRVRTLAGDFCKNAFGAEEVGRLPAPDGKTVLHADLKIGDSLEQIRKAAQAACNEAVT